MRVGRPRAPAFSCQDVQGLSQAVASRQISAAPVLLSLHIKNDGSIAPFK